MRIHFGKTYTRPADIVCLLKDRGLNVGDFGRAEHYIRNIGYYRLSAYLYPLLQKPKEAHRYKAGSTFQDALNLYRFDKKLRLFLFNEGHLQQLLTDFPMIDIKAMGFPANWQEEPLWRE